MTTFGQRVKQARELAGLSQLELAKTVRVTQAQISKIELGERLASTRTVEIAQTCGVNPRWLATGEGEMLASDQSGRNEPLSSLNRRELEMMKAWRNLTNAQQEHFFEQVKQTQQANQKLFEELSSKLMKNSER